VLSRWTRWAAAATALALPAYTPASPAVAPPPGHQVVTCGELLAAMRASRGFDPTATANGARLQAEVLLRLVRAAHARDPHGPPLFLDHETWFSAFLERTGLAADKAPLYARLARENGQDTAVDHRRERVLEGVLEGPEPLLAANVYVGWPDAPGAPQQFSYEDTLSTPRLEVTMKRVITYRLVDYGDMLLYGEIRGLRGRPTSGVLGALFHLIGEVPIVESRMALSADGLQISRGRGKKGLIDVTTTVTLTPEGRAEKGLPPGRADLQALEQRLKRKLRLAFKPLAAPPGR
jgi:hypothetical protein